MTIIGRLQETEELFKKDVLPFRRVSCHGLRSKSLPNKNHKILTIVGSAKSVLDDIELYGIHGDLMVINQVGFYYPQDEPYQHLVSLHSDHFRINDINRRHLRPQEKFHTYKTHTYGAVTNKIVKDKEFIDYIWNFTPNPKSSGILGCFIGIALGYKKIILLGIPLDNSVRFTDLGLDSTRDNSYYTNMYRSLYHDGSFDLMKGIIRSSSGNTRKILGEPTKEWIYG